MANWFTDAVAEFLQRRAQRQKKAHDDDERNEYFLGGDAGFGGVLRFPRAGGPGEVLFAHLTKVPRNQVAPRNLANLNSAFDDTLDIGLGVLEETKRVEVAVLYKTKAGPVVVPKAANTAAKPKVAVPESYFIILPIEEKMSQEAVRRKAGAFQDAIHRHLGVMVELHATSSTSDIRSTLRRVPAEEPVAAESEEPELLPLRMDKNRGLVPEPFLPEVASSDEDEQPLPPEDETVVDMAEARRLLEETSTDAEAATRH